MNDDTRKNMTMKPGWGLLEDSDSSTSINGSNGSSGSTGTSSVKHQRRSRINTNNIHIKQRRHQRRQGLSSDTTIKSNSSNRTRYSQHPRRRRKKGRSLLDCSFHLAPTVITPRWISLFRWLPFFLITWTTTTSFVSLGRCHSFPTSVGSGNSIGGGVNSRNLVSSLSPSLSPSTSTTTTATTATFLLEQHHTDAGSVEENKQQQQQQSEPSDIKKLKHIGEIDIDIGSADRQKQQEQKQPPQQQQKQQQQEHSQSESTDPTPAAFATSFSSLFSLTNHRPYHDREINEINLGYYDISTNYDRNNNNNSNDGKGSSNNDDKDESDIRNYVPIMGPLPEDDQKFMDRIRSSLRTVKNWDADIELIKEIREIIPWEELRHGNITNDIINSNSTGDGEENVTDAYLATSIPSSSSSPHDLETDRMLNNNANAHFLQRLCRWFPKEFMKWVNSPPCSNCGYKNIEMKGVRGPETDEEKEGEAKRVEVYHCPECGDNTTTFPRYNKVKKLFETRKGRCGEYSNLFGLFCRAVGFETRLVLDFSDHLWTEVWIGDAWVMADSCEGVIDKPSMYENGWGKDGLSYMIAIASDHIVDVTPRYTRKFMQDEFQTRRRTHTSSEQSCANIILQLNHELSVNSTNARIEELKRRNVMESAELNWHKQSTEWTEQEKYGRGRISGSLAWRKSRHEAGKRENNRRARERKDQQQQQQEVAGFQVEAFSPPQPNGKNLTLRVNPAPTGRYDGIIVANTPCAVGEADTISVVVVDEACFGSILQSKSFVEWSDLQNFVQQLPSGRIVLMQGKLPSDEKSDDKRREATKKKSFHELPRLGGWNSDLDVLEKGIAFIGQMDVTPDWTYCDTLDKCPPGGHQVELDTTGILESLQSKKNITDMRLRTERQTMPQKVAGRLPESVMPLKTQMMATEEQKRIAFTSFCKTSQGARYCGYTTKQESPVYLLDGTAYPFQKAENSGSGTATSPSLLSSSSSTSKSSDDKQAQNWNTFHYLPAPLVPDDDQGIITTTNENATCETPKYDVPMEALFFTMSLGDELLVSGNVTSRIPMMDCLHNARLIGLYFSAHWCGPCRSFTPMLAEMYEHLKEERSTHGLEIVFVSADHDEQSFNRYFSTMPWHSITYDHLPTVKQDLNMTYGVRGIPSLVILDAVSGQVVVPANQSRQEVTQACQKGELAIEEMFDSWLSRTPAETREMLSMLELSCEETTTTTKATDSDDLNDGDAEEPANPYLMRIEEEEQPQQQQQQQQESSTGKARTPTASSTTTTTTTTSSNNGTTNDMANRVKEIFSKLVAEGNDPNAAAAKAITIAAAEDHQQNTTTSTPSSGTTTTTTTTNETTTSPGELNGKAINIEATTTTSTTKLSSWPSGSSLPTLDEAFANCVELNSPSIVRGVLLTASKYLANVAREPWTPKYRTFRLNNKVADDKITRVEGAWTLLQCIGFEIFASTNHDFKATIPVSANLDRMRQIIDELQNGL